MLAGWIAQKVGPDFGFQDYDERWPYGAQHATDTKSPVEGEIEHSIGKLHSFAGQRLARDCRGRDHKRTIGIRFFQALREGNTGQKLADGYSMNPDRPRMIGRQFAERAKGQACPLPYLRPALSLLPPLH